MLTQPQIKAEVVIKLMANGHVAVTGPLGDKIFMYGLLEMAKEVVRMQGLGEEPKVSPISVVPKFQH